MAQGDIVAYNFHKTYISDANRNWLTEIHRITLHTGYTPNIGTHTTWSDVSATEYATGGGYTAGGITLASKTVTQDNTGNRGLYDAADVTWTSLTLSPATPSHAVISVFNNFLAVYQLVAYMVLGTTATNGTNYRILFSSSPAAVHGIV